MSEAVLSKIKELDSQDDYYGILKLIEEQSEPTLELALQYARACLNATHKTSDPYELVQKAHMALERYVSAGKDNPYWLFYKGYALYLDGLVPDALVRLERAARFVKIGRDDGLFSHIQTMRELCRQKMIESEFAGLKPEWRQQLMSHIETHFGKAHKLSSLHKVEVLHLEPTEEHPYHMLTTCGLAARCLPVPEGFESSLNQRLELCVMLPSNYKFEQDQDRDWPVYLLGKLIELVISAQSFIGFGYYVDYGAPFSRATAFTGLMLTALGEYPAESQLALLDGKEEVHFFEVIPLKPMEVHYRSQHTANELLGLFKKRGVMLTPIDEQRIDVVSDIATLHA
ncbi:MAG: suppressor of fused domain protein [Succinivibrio sp.]|nr:suppressor of fused domain protein [Succinivibrio sp.]